MLAGPIGCLVPAKLLVGKMELQWLPESAEVLKTAAMGRRHVLKHVPARLARDETRYYTFQTANSEQCVQFRVLPLVTVNVSLLKVTF